MGDEICEERGVGMEEERRGMVKWERFLPRVSVRVLLVESDDSTRQIIAALLRKCSYKVTAISDGLKAWETLQNKSHNIDLVLTEVEVPSVSGFALLSMIMDHDTYKNIPVIMMSSDDSINMVFKCMTKGAADFLVKPIRKNELKNLWQHVWRRHISIGRRDGAHGHQNENIAKKKLDNHSGEYVALEKKNCSEKGSEAQSSCTRSDMEAELYMQDMHDIKPRQERDLSPMVDTLSQESKENNQLESASLIHEGEAEDNFITLGSGVSTFNRACNPIEPTLEEDQSCELMEAMDEGKHCNEVIDLIGALDNQMQSSYGARDISPVQDGLSDASKKCKSNSVPHLELSLRKYQPSSYHELENDEWNMLSHSNFSAFSLFSGKPVVPTPLRAVRTFTEQNECFDSSNLSIEVTKPPGLELNRQEEMAAQCSPFRAIPFTIPIKQMTLNSSCTAYHAAIQPIYYSQAVHPLWSATWQNAATANSPHQSQHKDLNSQQSHRQDDQSPTSVIRDREQRQEDVKEGDEQRHVSSVTCESGSDECNVNTSVSSLEKNVESANWEDRFAREVINPPDSHQLSQREAALNKFRMKRKERCFDKKVRYQSRKRLAEQRPRVKGQFVRQV